MSHDIFRYSYVKNIIGRRNNYDLFGSDFIEDLHWGKLFVHLFGKYYSRYRIKQKVNNDELIKSLISRFFLKPNQIIRIDKTKEEDFLKVNYEKSEVLLIIKSGLFLSIMNDSLDIMYSSDISEAERNGILKLVDEFKMTEPVLKKFHMVQHDGSFELADFDVKHFDIDIETHYNDDFLDIHNIISTSLNTKDKNGIVLLHGKYGTGKTYYIRHLISKVDRKFIYFPLNMIETINSPEFLPFLSEQRNSVLILEDCENLLVHRDNGSSNAPALSNLLNLGDGLLSDALSVNVMCTFNAGIKKIDDAILRKGRLIARYEFKELEINKSQALAQKIGKNVTIERPMTVSDIYNIDEKNFENRKSKAIGFKAA